MSNQNSLLHRIADLEIHSFFINLNVSKLNTINLPAIGPPNDRIEESKLNFKILEFMNIFDINKKFTHYSR